MKIQKLHDMEQLESTLFQKTLCLIFKPSNRVVEEPQIPIPYFHGRVYE